MAMLRLRPAIKDYIWGGDRLKTEWGFETACDVAAEAWVLSCHPDGVSVVASGEYAGWPLTEALKETGLAVLGTKAASCDGFPILIKLIDAKRSLSVQVHPDDAYAGAHEGQRGKTEVWYVLDADTDAFLYYGFRHAVSREEFEARIRDNTLLEVLNAVPVRKGDVFFIPPGTLHAIGGGILIAEIQQSSNVTYRIYDYGRRDASGNTRPLHIPQALDVTSRTKPEMPDFGRHIAQCDYFTVDRIDPEEMSQKGASGEVDDSSFLSMVFTGGSGVLQLRGTGEQLSCSRGDSVLIPAGAGEWSLEGDADVLLTRL